MLNYNVLYKKIDTKINAHKDEITKNVIDLIKTKTVNFKKEDYPKSCPDNMLVPGMEYKIIEFLKEELEKAHISYETYAENSKRPHLIIRIGHKDPIYKKLLVIAQADTFPTNNIPWKKLENPFNPEVIAGKIYGKGIIESKGPVTALLHTAKILKEFEEKIPGEIILAIVSDGIVHYGNSFKQLLENETIKPNEIITTFTGKSIKEPIIGEMGHLIIEIETEGKNPDANTVQAMSEISQKLKKIKFMEKNSLFSIKPSISIQKIEGKVNHYSHENHCSGFFEITYLPNQNPKTILSEIKTTIDDLNLKGITTNINIVENLEPYELKKESSIINAMKEIVSIKTNSIERNTLLKIYQTFADRVVGIGISEKTNTSTADESIKQTELVNFVKVLSKVGIKVSNEKQ